MLSALTSYINDEYGSKRGLVNYLKFKLYSFLGFYRKYRNVDFGMVNRLVFICSGNICRSCLAEYLTKKKGADAESYGLDCRGGDSADPRTIVIGKSLGLDLGDHVTRNIEKYEYRDGDLIVAMDPLQARKIHELYPERNLVTCLTIWSVKSSPYLHDPYGASLKYFRKCGTKINQAVDCLIKKCRSIGSFEDSSISEHL